MTTFKVDHPTIKEISFGDMFITIDNEIIEFYSDDPYDEITPYTFLKIPKEAFVYENLVEFFDNLDYEERTYYCLTHELQHEHFGYYVKGRYLTLKDKINLL